MKRCSAPPITPEIPEGLEVLAAGARKKTPTMRFLGPRNKYHSPRPPHSGGFCSELSWLLDSPQGKGGGRVGEGRCLRMECSEHGGRRHKCGAEEGPGLFPPEPRVGAGRRAGGGERGRPLATPCVRCVRSCSPLHQPPAHPKKPRARGFASIAADPMRAWVARGGALPWQHKDLGGGDGNQGCF